MGVHTIGDLAQKPEAALVQRFGKAGHDLAQHARGIDERLIVTEHDTKSISKETTFVRDVRDEAHLRSTLRELADDVGRRLRQEGLHGTTIRLKLRRADFTTLTRQTTLAQATQHDDAIFTAACELLRKAWSSGQAVRLIGVGVSGFVDSAQQLGLWDTPAQDAQATRLESALDSLRDRFGSRIIRRASDLDET
jgi:DNA polymerase-4